MKILAIESSCDETSMAIIDENYHLYAHVINSQIDKFKDLGGVVPEMSARLHEENIYYVYKQTLLEADTKIEDIDYIAVTYGPGLVGSLLCGVNFAKSIALIHDIKLIAVNHMQAHIHALDLEYDVKYPLMSLIVSGGHTELVYSKDAGSYEIIGQTLDDAVGECFDKVARILDLGYPGGPLIDRLSKDIKGTYKLPTPMDDNSYNFSFSGLKSACFNAVNQMKMKNIEIDKADFAASFQSVATDILIKKLSMAVDNYAVNSVAIVGGVSANSSLKEKAFKTFDNPLIPSLIYSTDNAAMIAAKAVKMTDNTVSVEQLNARPQITVEDEWKD